MIGLGRCKEEAATIDSLLSAPFLREEEIPDLERFILHFPDLTERYIPVQIIGEGTFSTVYKAIDVRHYEADNGSWLGCSKQDRHDALRLFAHIHKLQNPPKAEPPESPVYERGSVINRSLLKFMAKHIELMKARNDPMVSPKSSTTLPKNARKRTKEDTAEEAAIEERSIMPHFVALKRITPTSCPDRLADEIGFIARYGGKHNVIPVIEGIRHEDQVIAVFPLFHAPDFREILFKMTISDIADYMRLLFEALAHIHRNQTIHRDIKPSNFMFCPRTSSDPPQALLVDFGLAQNTQDMNVSKDVANIWRKADHRASDYAKVMRNMRAADDWGTVFHKDVRPSIKAQRAGTRGFRAPEVLLKVFHQDYAIDVWSSGVILLTLLTRRYPFFQSMDDNDAVVEIACLFGSAAIKELARKVGRVFNCSVPSVPEEHVGWHNVVQTLCPEMQPPEECYDLLERTMCLDPKERITAEEALEHPFIGLFLPRIKMNTAATFVRNGKRGVLSLGSSLKIQLPALVIPTRTLTVPHLTGDVLKRAISPHKFIIEAYAEDLLENPKLAQKCPFGIKKLADWNDFAVFLGTRKYSGQNLGPVTDFTSLKKEKDDALPKELFVLGENKTGRIKMTLRELKELVVRFQPDVFIPPTGFDAFPGPLNEKIQRRCAENTKLFHGFFQEGLDLPISKSVIYLRKRLGWEAFLEALKDERIGLYNAGLAVDLAEAGLAIMTDAVEPYLMDLKDVKYQDDDSVLQPGCQCVACTEEGMGYMKGAVHHYLVVEEMLAPVLLTCHNLHQMEKLLSNQ